MVSALSAVHLLMAMCASSRTPGLLQWLMYWVCYAVLLSLEQVAWPVLRW